MEPWLLLLASIGMAWITVEMIRWLDSFLKLKQKDMDRVIGLDTRGPGMPPRWRSYATTRGLFFIWLMMGAGGVMTVVLVIATIKAFAG